MPLPWLIGAAVVAAAAAVVKAVNDDDSSSSSDSGDAERLRQEREARLQRERDGLVAKIDGLKKDRLVEARDLLARSVATLLQPPRKIDAPSASDFEKAIVINSQSISAYAQGLNKILSIPEHSEKHFTQKEKDEFLTNLHKLESLTGPITFGEEEQRSLVALSNASSRLDRLQNLKQQLEQQR